MTDENSETLEVRLASEVDKLLNTGEMTYTSILRGEAEGAIPNGSIIEKCNSAPGDSFPDGQRGAVISSVDVGNFIAAEDGDELKEMALESPFLYCILWLTDRPIPAYIHGARIRPLS